MKAEKSRGETADLPAWIRARRREVESVLENRLPARAPGDDPGRLIEAMRYSLLAPGKRLRPIVALAAAEAARPPNGDAFDAEGDAWVVVAAASVELVHCYSLIHDDLPAMDDDDLRRGKPSNHKVYGEATAILAGDALLTLAFQWLAEAGVASGRPADFGLAALALARGAGTAGMVRGQARDLGESPPHDLTGLEQLHGEKTAALFRAAAEVGAAAAGAAPVAIAAVGEFGQRLGVAFQHVDDLEDGDHRAHALAVRARVPVLLHEAAACLDRLAPSGGEVTADSASGRGAMLRGLAAELLARAGAPTESPSGDR